MDGHRFILSCQHLQLAEAHVKGTALECAIWLFNYYDVDCAAECSRIDTQSIGYLAEEHHFKILLLNL